jgi:hypothetical protein
MMNNLLTTIGKPVENRVGLEGLNLTLLPTYDEVIAGQFGAFPNFVKLRDAILEYGDAHFTEEYTVGQFQLHILDESKNVPGGQKARQSWDSLISVVSEDTRRLLTQIKEDFNRNYQRPFVLFTFLYNIFKGLDFSRWTLEDYSKVVEDEPRGFSPKVLGCFLQQSFGKYECIPIDIWVRSFFEEVLQTRKEEIIHSGTNLGCFERFIWNTVQLRKTNQPFFNDVLFCIKTGVLHSTDIVNRKANPLSCKLCRFREAGCPVFNDIKQESVLIIKKSRTSDQNTNFAHVVTLRRPKMDVEIRREIFFDQDRLEADRFPPEKLQEAYFIITVSDAGVPDEVYALSDRKKGRWDLVDNMSAFSVGRRYDEGMHVIEELAAE